MTPARRFAMADPARPCGAANKKAHRELALRTLGAAPMRKIGAREAALLFVAVAALIGATHVAPAATHFGAGAHHGGSPPRAAGNSPRMGGPHDRSPRAGAGAHSSATGRVASRSLSRPTFHANRLGEHSSVRSFRGRGPTAARAVHGHKPATLAKHLHRDAPELRRRSAGPAYVRPGYHGGFTGWSGPLFWPHAYDDIFDYTFWPYEFDETFWAYAYADVYNSIVWPYGDSVGSIGVSGGPPRLTRSRAGTPAGQSRETTQLCGDRTPGLTDWPIERIERAVHPTLSQRGALDDLGVHQGHRDAAVRMSRRYAGHPARAARCFGQTARCDGPCGEDHSPGDAAFLRFARRGAEGGFQRDRLARKPDRIA
jgi:hypothetical protein